MQEAPITPWRWIATAVALIALTGCASNAPKVFNEFADRARQIERIYLLNDVLVQDDVKGAHDRVDVNENRELLALVAGEVRKTLAEKGYRVETGAVDTVGAIAGRDTQYAVYRGDPESRPRWDSEEHTDLQWSPFHYEDTTGAPFAEDPVKLLHQRLFAVKTPARLKAQTFDSASAFALPERSAILVTQSHGRRVPGAKKGAQFFLSAVLTMGMFMTWEESSISHRLYLLDAQTGEVLWSDFHVKTGGAPQEKDIRLAIGKAFKALPARTTTEAAAAAGTDAEITGPDPI